MIAVVPLATAGAGNLFSNADHSSVLFHWICFHSIFNDIPLSTCCANPSLLCISSLMPCCCVLSFLYHCTFRLAESLFLPISEQYSLLPFKSYKLSFVVILNLVQCPGPPVLGRAFLFFFLLSTWNKLEIIWEEGTSTTKMPPSICPVGKSVRAFYWLVFEVGGPNPLWEVPHWVGGPGLYFKKQSDWASCELDEP